MGNDVIQEIRREGERFLREINTELYENLAGLKNGSNLKGIYKACPTLGDSSLFFSVKDILPKDKEEEKRLKLTLDVISRSIIGDRTARVRDEILTAESREELQIEGKTIPYRAAAAEIKKEPKRARREEINKKRNQQV